MRDEQGRDTLGGCRVPSELKIEPVNQRDILYSFLMGRSYVRLTQALQLMLQVCDCFGSMCVFNAVRQDPAGMMSPVRKRFSTYTFVFLESAVYVMRD